MLETKLIVGLDISKDSVDYHQKDLVDPKNVECGNVPNDLPTLRKLVNKYDRTTTLFVFEPTGTYSDKLLSVLEEVDAHFSLVNPSQSHYYALSKGIVSKNDQQAAKLLSEMGAVGDLNLYQSQSQENRERKQLLKAIDALEKEKQRHQNRIHALEQCATPNQVLLTCYKNLIDGLDKEMEQLYAQIDTIEEKAYDALFKLATSIQGIGPKTALWLITFSDGLKNFENVKQLIKFFGLAPRSHVSGTSVNIKGKITKNGNSKVRANLYMAALSAIVWNPPCKQLYQRLKAKGKPHFKAIVAVMVKLLKQFFGVIKSKTPFDKEYHLK